ncbi:Beta-glucanase [Frondihabitans sp. 762G35]|uniref:glycoside hydrolase family 16 protein n=1 Tax=Frondihabitans sp. 762G35 TaxID=1446794 RepID=UPI000D217F60|nr:glycoside hydrolase family 16 protein [Frondihabitans sp. 762G35]ARC57365.1 Beta-glucanase [Frondihabitans sp. 762G35]
MRLRGKALLGLTAAAAVGGVVVASAGHGPAAQAAASTTMPVGTVSSNGTTWKPVVSQDFTKTAGIGQFASVYGAAWNGYSSFSDTSGKGLYAPSRVLSAKNGSLDFSLHSQSGRPMVAAPMPNGYKPQTYGRYAIRFRTDAVAGYKMAFLLWPTSDDWNDGEIDWPDGNLAGNAYAASAVKGSYKNGKMTFDGPPHSASPVVGTGWHTAVTEWTPGKVRWYWDGRMIGQTSNAAGVPTKPMRWTLQAETNTDGKTVSTTAKGHIQVDWVVQYSR